MSTDAASTVTGMTRDDRVSSAAAEIGRFGGVRDVEVDLVNPGAEPPGEPPRRRRFSVVRDTVGAFVGAVMGLVPHVMHHVGLLAGAALITGAAGNALFFAIGLVFSVPLLRRLNRRFHTWRAPAIAIVIFAALFSLSAFVIGPAISGATSDNAPTSPSQTPGEDHNGHHPDA